MPASKRDLVELYAKCYPGVKNELAMRADAHQLHGRLLYDDQVVDGYLHGMAWLLFKQEDLTLHFPETYGREVSATLYDLWNNERQVFTKPGYYGLGIPDSAAGIILVRVRCMDRSNEQEYQQAFDVLQDITISDIGLGVNDYEDSQSEAPMASTLKTLKPDEISGKEFFAIATVVYDNNPFPTHGTGKTAALLEQTGRMTPVELEDIKRIAMKKYALA